MHAELIRQRHEIDYGLRRLADAYRAKMVEYRQVSHGIIGIEEELRNLKERNE
ncbi:hypothetical protein [Neobacillus niacini]|uniref:hypothetical protein n=1 Tax=Neobacillus niacini TaxID=86668 RepID=UPI0028667A9F|nr:hypothetical protein [Neobacillus niacini]MDR7001600.1 hypothetical protein [Neobacillus niacini]